VKPKSRYWASFLSFWGVQFEAVKQKEAKRGWRGERKTKEEQKREEKRKEECALRIRVCVHLFVFFVFFLFFCLNSLKLVRRECVRQRKLNNLIIFLYYKIIFI
jgi:Serpentine type 7TM GPCR chemoreceptor Srv